MVKTVFFVPKTDNDGNIFEPKMFDALEQKLVELFEGFTAGGMVRGAWIDGDEVFNDESHVYIVALKTLKQLPAWIELIEWVRVEFEQHTIYVEISGATEILGA